MIEFTESVVRITGMGNMLYRAKEISHRDDRSFGKKCYIHYQG
jgi:hypothetical protein